MEASLASPSSTTVADSASANVSLSCLLYLSAFGSSLILKTFVGRLVGCCCWSGLRLVGSCFALVVQSFPLWRRYCSHLPLVSGQHQYHG